MNDTCTNCLYRKRRYGDRLGCGLGYSCLYTPVHTFEETNFRKKKGERKWTNISLASAALPVTKDI